MKKIGIVLLLVALFAAIILRLANNHKSLSMKKPADHKATTSGIAVNVCNVKKITMVDTLKFTGVLNPWKEINIAAEIQGKITELHVEAGQTKKQGALLARIDDRLKQLAVENSKISVDKLNKDFERTENLFKGGVATQQQVDDAKNSLETAKIELGQNQKMLDQTIITAPFSGVITEKKTEEGAYINTGSAIASIVDISMLKVKLNVSETNVYRLKTGVPAEIAVEAYPGIIFDGKITFISEKGDDTHNYAVEIMMKNNPNYPLKAGTFVTASIILSADTDHLYIPRGALQGSSKDASVYVVENNKAILKRITVGSAHGDYLLVESGLSGGEKIVVEGQINLENGKQVTVINK
jgi:RND family efflux transporter MFP subunit